MRKPSSPFYGLDWEWLDLILRIGIHSILVKISELNIKKKQLSDRNPEPKCSSSTAVNRYTLASGSGAHGMMEENKGIGLTLVSADNSSCVIGI